MSTVKSDKSWIGGVAAAAAASLCCITPLIAVVGGVSGAASAFSWIDPFRPYLIGTTAVVLGFAWYRNLKPQPQQADCCAVEEKPKFIQSKTFLGIVTLVAAMLVAFPYYSNVFYPKAKKTNVAAVGAGNLQTVQFNIEGMTCSGCTEHVNGELAKVNGVVDYKTSYEEGTSIVTFDSTVTPADSLVSAVGRTGYTVTSHIFIYASSNSNE